MSKIQLALHIKVYKLFNFLKFGSLRSEAIGSQSGTNPDYLAGFKILETPTGSSFGKIICTPGEYSECVFCVAASLVSVF